MQTNRTYRSSVLAGKRPRGVCTGQRTSFESISPADDVLVASVKSKAATIRGEIGGVVVEIMLDSGSSVSLIQRRGIVHLEDKKPLKLVTAAREVLPVTVTRTSRWKRQSIIYLTCLDLCIA